MNRRTKERLALVGELAAQGVLAARLRLRAALRRAPPPWPGNRPLRALFLSAFPRGHHGTIHRQEGWRRWLSSRGVEVEVGYPSSDEEFAAFGAGDPEANRRYSRAVRANRRRQLLSAREADVVWYHRALFPYGPLQRPTFERVLARLAPRSIYDIYDSLWTLKRGAHEAAGSRLARWLNPGDFVERTGRIAAGVTVSNAFLADHMRRETDSPCHVLPMVLDPADYVLREHVERDPVVVGWMGNRWALDELKSVAPALAAAARTAPFRLRVVSSAPCELPDLDVESLTHPFSAESERADLAAMDVGLLPMPEDETGRGKSPLKLLQYAAAGLPVVATPVAIDPAHFVAGESILYARTGEEWRDAVVSLVRSVERRREMGANARRVLEERYSYDAHGAAFRSYLEAIAARAPMKRRPPRAGGSAAGSV